MIILGILIMIMLGVIIVTITSRLIARAERKQQEQQKIELAQQALVRQSGERVVENFPTEVTLSLAEGEDIADSRLTPAGLLLRVVKDGKTSHLLLIGTDGRTRTRFQVERTERAE